MNGDIIKKLPFSMLAEQALLGSILIDPPALTQISDICAAAYSISSPTFSCSEYARSLMFEQVSIRRRIRLFSRTMRA